MRENRTSGSVQGAPGNRRSYCETWVSRVGREVDVNSLAAGIFHEVTEHLRDLFVLVFVADKNCT
jgi:hypothetical protein